MAQKAEQSNPNTPNTSFAPLKRALQIRDIETVCWELLTLQVNELSEGITETLLTRPQFAEVLRLLVSVKSSSSKSNSNTQIPQVVSDWMGGE